MPASDSLGCPEGLTTVPSHFGPKETMERLEVEIRSNVLTIFARIDHAVEASDVGLMLSLTNLIIFGKARAGTPLMQAAQTVVIDLPLKALGWEDASGKTKISYNEPGSIAHRHEIADAKAVVSKMTDVLRVSTTTAASPLD